MIVSHTHQGATALEIESWSEYYIAIPYHGVAVRNSQSFGDKFSQKLSDKKIIDTTTTSAYIAHSDHYVPCSK